MIPDIMEDILELVSVLSLPAGLGQLVGVFFWKCAAGVPHNPKYLARSIRDTWGCKEHLEISFVPFAFQLTYASFQALVK